MPSAPKKKAQIIIESGNNYLGALKGNQSGLLKAVETHSQPQRRFQQINKRHRRIEKRTISIIQNIDGIPQFPGLRTLIKIHSERQVFHPTFLQVSHEVHYYIASFVETAQALGERIRGY